MKKTDVEIEVKIAVEDANEARRRLTSTGAVPVSPRAFEDNTLYDTPDGSLGSAGRVLRLRRLGPVTLLTYKEPCTDLAAETGMKVNREIECHVDDHTEMARILMGLGYEPVFRYQKNREVYALAALTITLDETPIGTFVELEGSEKDIRDAATRLGYGEDRFLTGSYRSLHLAKHPGSREMVFPGRLL